MAWCGIPPKSVFLQTVKVKKLTQKLFTTTCFSFTPRKEAAKVFLTKMLDRNNFFPILNEWINDQFSSSNIPCLTSTTLYTSNLQFVTKNKIFMKICPNSGRQSTFSLLLIFLVEVLWLSCVPTTSPQYVPTSQCCVVSNPFTGQSWLTHMTVTPTCLKEHIESSEEPILEVKCHCEEVVSLFRKLWVCSKVFSAKKSWETFMTFQYSEWRAGLVSQLFWKRDSPDALHKTRSESVQAEKLAQLICWPWLGITAMSERFSQVQCNSASETTSSFVCPRSTCDTMWKRVEVLASNVNKLKALECGGLQWLALRLIISRNFLVLAFHLTQQDIKLLNCHLDLFNQNFVFCCQPATPRLFVRPITQTVQPLCQHSVWYTPFQVHIVFRSC